MFDKNTITPLILSFIAGIFTVLGAFIVFFTNKNNKKLITFSLSFSAGIMITVSLTDLYPTSQKVFIENLGNLKGILYSLLFMLIGIFLALLIDIFIPSYEERKSSKENSDLYKVGLVTMIALMLHNFPEGILTFISGYEDIFLGTSITTAIALHNIPEGISIALPIYLASKNKAKAFKFTFLSGMAEPFGALIAFLFLKPFINDFILAVCFSIVSGIMLYISFGELIPEARKSGYKKIYLFSLFLGIFIIPLSHGLLK